jgi:3-phenylpropionate/cinnamic acid dioxygenase small subunit
MARPCDFAAIGAPARYRGRVSGSATAIANLLYTYGRLVDAGDFEGLGRLLAHARLRDESGRLDLRGAEAVTRLYEATTRRYPDTGTPKTQHVITNPIIEVDEASGSATCRACYTVFQQTATLPLQPIVAGRYESRFERVDGCWRFASHQLAVDLAGDLSQHLLVDLDPMRGGNA